MTIGEHLDELRGCLIRSVAVLFVACLVFIYPAKYVLMIIARPVILVLRRHGQPTTFLQTSPVETIVIYIKVVLICALIVAGPYVIYQFWLFVSQGLYRKERRWVLRLVPISVGLFLTGVAFMYTLVLVVSLNFLVGFSNWLPLPDPTPTLLEKTLLGVEEVRVPATQPAEDGVSVAIYGDDPPTTQPTGALWFNVGEQKLKLRGVNETYAIQLFREGQGGLVTTHFKIGDYLSFILVMIVAFGLAFQMPLVVVFLTRTGIVPAATLRKYRRIVILVIVVIAGMLAPPDLLSHLLLSGPMILLFELGLLLSRRANEPAAA